MRSLMLRRLPTHLTGRASVRWFGWDGHGTDLLSDSLAHNAGVPKIILHAHGPSGFDVNNTIKNMDPKDPDLLRSNGIVHMSGSILALPSACYMWNVRDPNDVTFESLSPVLLHQPKLEYLFLGCDGGSVPQSIIQDLRQKMAAEGIEMVIEPMDLPNAMGTFNVLNGEDRLVGAALILPPQD